jgi:hypothetical protein
MSQGEIPKENFGGILKKKILFESIQKPKVKQKKQLLSKLAKN